MPICDSHALQWVSTTRQEDGTPPIFRNVQRSFDQVRTDLLHIRVHAHVERTAAIEAARTVCFYQRLTRSHDQARAVPIILSSSLARRQTHSLRQSFGAHTQIIPMALAAAAAATTFHTVPLSNPARLSVTHGTAIRIHVMPRASDHTHTLPQVDAFPSGPFIQYTVHMSAGLRAASVMLIAENAEAWSLIRNHSHTMPMLYKNVAECLFCRALTAVATHLNGGQQMPSTCYTPLTLVGDITMDALTQRIARRILTMQLASLALPLDSLQTNFATDRHATALYMSLGAMFGIDVQTFKREAVVLGMPDRMGVVILRTQVSEAASVSFAFPSKPLYNAIRQINARDFPRTISLASCPEALRCEHAHCLLCPLSLLPP